MSDIATQTNQAHLRTREVELYGIAACLLSHLGQLDPLLLELAHDRGYDHLRGIVLLEATEDIEVHLIRILGQLLHIAETGKRGAFLHSIEAR